MTGLRKALAQMGMKTAAFIIMLCYGLLPKRRDLDYNYEEYLGPNYKNTMKEVNVSTIVCNHSCWADINAIIASSFCPGFGAK